MLYICIKLLPVMFTAIIRIFLTLMYTAAYNYLYNECYNATICVYYTNEGCYYITLFCDIPINISGSPLKQIFSNPVQFFRTAQ